MNTQDPDTELVHIAKTLTGGARGTEMLAAGIDNQNQIYARMQARGKIVRPLKPGWLPPSQPKRWQPPR